MTNAYRASVAMLDRFGVGALLRPLLCCARDQREAFRHIAWKLSRQSKIKSYMRDHDTRRLHIGASNHSLPGWLNTDLEPASNDIVFLDARERFPFSDNFFDYVFCEHFIEHFDRAGAVNCLKEAFRCLKPDGILRIATPDLRQYIGLFSASLTPDQQRFLQLSADFYRWEPPGGPCIALNHLVYNWGHRFIWTADELITALERAGFVEVTRVEIGASAHPELELLERHDQFLGKEMNRFETMAFEAKKDAASADSKSP